MKIKKVYNGVVPNGKILNSKNTSQNDTYSCDYINEKLLDNYSTEEQVIGKWMGKPLYRKVITLRDYFEGAEKDIKAFVSNNIEHIFLKEGYYWNEDPGLSKYRLFINCGSGINGVGYAANAFMEGNNIVLRINGGSNYYNAVLIVEYTKTTD